MRQPYAFFDDALQEHGLTFHVDLPVMGNSLVTGDPSLIRQIASHPHLQAGAAVPAIRALLGERSLIALDAEDHTRRRRIVAPVFREHLPQFDKLTTEITRRVMSELPANAKCSIYEPLRRISLLVILHAMFGDDADVVERGFQLVDRFIHSFSNPLVLFLRPLRTDLGRFSPWGKAVRNRRALCDFIQQQMPDCKQSSREAHGAMLPRILHAAEAAQVSSQDLQQEILALLLFGHDTGAAALSWAVVHLLQNPEYIAAIQRETQAGSVSDWQLLRCCLDESLRLCPVVPHLSRKARREIQLDKYTVKAGQTVIPATYLAHHNPQVYAQPHEFQPQRFIDSPPPAHAYFPFGVGDRTCVGKPFVLRQMMLILATLLRHCRLEFEAGYQPRPIRRQLLITPAQGGRVVVRPSTVTAASIPQKPVAGGAASE